MPGLLHVRRAPEAAPLQLTPSFCAYCRLSAAHLHAHLPPRSSPPELALPCPTIRAIVSVREIVSARGSHGRSMQAKQPRISCRQRKRILTARGVRGYSHRINWRYVQYDRKRPPSEAGAVEGHIKGGSGKGCRDESGSSLPRFTDYVLFQGSIGGFAHSSKRPANFADRDGKTLCERFRGSRQ